MIPNGMPVMKNEMLEDGEMLPMRYVQDGVMRYSIPCDEGDKPDFFMMNGKTWEKLVAKTKESE